MIAVIIVLSITTFIWLGHYTRHGEAINVPNVKQLNVDKAKILIEKNGIECIVIDSNYVKGLPAGTVLDQSPDAGSKVKEGRIIYLIINSDRVPMINIPDIIENSSLRQAEAKLRGLGFKLTEPEYTSGDKDWVYGLKYNGRSLLSGDKVPREAVITIVAGNGFDSMPNDSLNNDSTLLQDNDMSEDDSWF